MSGQDDGAVLVHELLERSAERVPSRPLVVERGGTRTYAEIDAAANALACELIRFGLASGDRVALLAKNSSFYVESYFGILKAGGVAVPLNTASDPALLAHVLQECGARVLVVGPKMERLILRCRGGLAGVELVIAPHADRLGHGAASLVYDGGGSAAAPKVTIRAVDPASIVYTSGSTGRPRGAILSHGAICANVASVLAYLKLDEHDRVLQILPMYYVYGKSVLNTHVAVGGAVVVEDRFQYPKVALDRLEDEACTGLSGVPSTFSILLERTNLHERELPALRYVTQAGGPMSPSVTRALMEALPGKSVFVMYGATEASARLSYVPPDELPLVVGSIGRPIEGVELTPRRADGTECDVDEVGELVARGPNLMTGYWNALEETARVLDEHGYHTGDLARRDARGIFWVVGRTSDMIKVGGHRVAAQEIEHALLDTGLVSEAAVLGEEDAILGERLVAFVVPRHTLTLDNLGAALRQRLPLYKIPRDVRIEDSLPKNESGKVMKEALRNSSKRGAPSE